MCNLPKGIANECAGCPGNKKAGNGINNCPIPETLSWPDRIDPVKKTSAATLATATEKNATERAAVMVPKPGLPDGCPKNCKPENAPDSFCNHCNKKKKSIINQILA
jgi:hypothetical protein